VEDTQEKTEEEDMEVDLDLAPKFDEHDLNEGEMRLLESTWDDPKEEQADKGRTYPTPSLLVRVRYVH